MSVTADGGFLIADGLGDRIRRVSPGGTITTVAGNGTQGFGPDGGAATASALDTPDGVAATRDGGFVIADTGNNRVRRVSPGGTITTIAGTAAPFRQGTAISGDNGPGTLATLNNPRGVAEANDGAILIGDTSNSRVRRVAPDGIITTLAGTGGTGVYGFGGDGGPAGTAQLNNPSGVAVAADGDVLIADTGNSRIRSVDYNGGPPPPTTTKPPPPPEPAIGRLAVVRPVAGVVTVQAPHGTAVDLEKLKRIPVGSIIDTTRGRVSLTTSDGHGGTQTAQFYEGRFRVRQSRRSVLTVLELTDKLTCTKAKPRTAKARASSAAAARKSRRKRRRHLWGRGKGRFRIDGRYATASVVGTVWLVSDSCDSTRVRVKEGRVKVRDLARKRTITVTAGKQRTILAPRSKRR